MEVSTTVTPNNDTLKHALRLGEFHYPILVNTSLKYVQPVPPKRCVGWTHRIEAVENSNRYIVDFWLDDNELKNIPKHKRQFFNLLPIRSWCVPSTHDELSVFYLVGADVDSFVFETQEDREFYNTQRMITHES